ncbi:MAG: MarR family transcriptional regulator [Acidimicrobiia bacterium]|nr:MarR family transcriptional regulator [Acidimicrobiia bacterium]
MTELIDEVRLLYNQFMELLDDLHRDVGLTPSQRAVLEHLRRGEITVPSLARERGVTRQHIQSVVNDLVDLGLAETSDNPAHKRSPLIGLTPEGDRAIAAAIAREQQFMRTHLGDLDEREVRAAARTLSQFRSACAAGIPHEGTSSSPRYPTTDPERSIR